MWWFVPHLWGPHLWSTEFDVWSYHGARVTGRESLLLTHLVSSQSCTCIRAYEHSFIHTLLKNFSFSDTDYLYFQFCYLPSEWQRLRACIYKDCAGLNLAIFSEFAQLDVFGPTCTLWISWVEHVIQSCRFRLALLVYDALFPAAVGLADPQHCSFQAH